MVCALFTTSAVTAIGGLIDHKKELVSRIKQEEKIKFTSVIDEEFPDLCLKTGVLFPLTVLPPQPPCGLPSDSVH